VEIPTLYDDTHRGKWAFDFEIASMGNLPNLLAYLEYYDPAQTDGSIGICVAGGRGNFISKVRSFGEINIPQQFIYLDRNYMILFQRHIGLHSILATPWM
jgi:hypothetical protein